VSSLCQRAGLRPASKRIRLAHGCRARTLRYHPPGSGHL